MGVVGLILILLGILAAGSFFGLILGIPLIGLGAVLCILAVIKGGLSALFRLGSPKKD